MKKILILIVFVFCSFVSAHGIDDKVIKAYCIETKLEDGSAFAGTTVKIYAPGNFATPYREKVTDGEGRVYFAPDKKGLWLITIRDNTGHGINREIVVDDKAILPSSSGPSRGQKIIMAICVIWGLVGTALYFTGRKKA